MRHDRRRALRRTLPLVLVAAAVLLVLAVAGGPRGDGPPLDPTASGRTGTKALVDVLDELGVAVRVTEAVDEGDTIALLLSVSHAGGESEALRRWVRGGGTLVVADPQSTFTPAVSGAAGIGPLHPSVARACDVAAFGSVARVAVGGGVVYEDPDGPAVTCFPRGEGHWLVATPEGAGTVVALGGPEALTNAALDQFDNALLAAALLIPEEGASLAFLHADAGGPGRDAAGGSPGEGTSTLRELVADPVWYALAQLLLAFLVVVAWRARRLGAPVREPQPVHVAGSELVAAVGNLLQQTRARGQAARLLRDDLRRALAESLGLPTDSPPEAVAQAASRRTGRRPTDLVALLTGADPVDEAQLVDLAHDLEAARTAALAGPTADTPREEPSHAH